MARGTGGRIRAVIFLIISFGAAAVATVVIYFVLANYQEELVLATVEEETVLVMVAKHDLGQGHTISGADLEMTELPPEYVPDSVLRKPEQAVGRVPRERILQREFIREERLADPKAGHGLVAIIPRGMRALSINISAGSAVSGFLNPGNYVDVLVTIQGDGTRPAETVTLLQAVTVLAVNARLGGGKTASGSSRPSVTLAVTPELAEKLTHAVAQGNVTLTLRNDIDVTQVETNSASTDEMLMLLGDTDDRITVTEWRAQAQKQSSATLLIIHGQDTKQEKAGN